MTAVLEKQAIPEPAQKIYTEADVNLAINNIGVLSMAYVASKILNPYARTFFNSAFFLFSASQYLHTLGMISHSHPIEKKLHYPLIHMNVMWSPVCRRIQAVGLVLTVARNGYSQLHNYFKSSHKDQSQSVLTGVLLHGFNTVCQMYFTKQTWEGPEAAKPNEEISPAIAAKELGVNPDPNCEQIAQTNPWKKGTTIPNQVLDACKTTCKELQKNYYKKMVDLRDCKTPTCLAIQQKINDMQAIAREGYGCVVPKNEF